MIDAKTTETSPETANGSEANIQHDPNIGYYSGDGWEIKTTVTYKNGGDYTVEVEVLKPETGTLEATPFKNISHVFPDHSDEVIRVREIVYYFDRRSGNAPMRMHTVTADEQLCDREEVICIRVVEDKTDPGNPDPDPDTKGKDIRPKRPKVALIRKNPYLPDKITD